YFHSLFAGNPVKGFPIYSRSTGKKSALVAAPIVVDNKVIGALGTSIFLEELRTRLNRAFALPQNYMWFVLNAEGNTMLDDNSDFIFMNPLTQGSPSLREAVTEALQHENGPIQYELESLRHGHYRKLRNIDWWMFLTKIEGAQIPPPPRLTVSLERFVPDLQNSLAQIDASLARLITQRKVDVKNEREIRALLGALLEENLHIVEASYIDPKGFLRYIEPRDYRNFENVDISSQAHMIAMHNKPGPILSSGFMAVEHFLAMVISRPLYDSDKHFAGCINLLIRPELLIDALLKQTTIPDNYELWIMQTDGMIIYDQDREEIGKMLFSDPLYTGFGNLLELGRQIVAAPSGEGRYIFLAPELKQKVIKHAIWQTVRLHDREWRVVLAYRPYE
ncbi:MAG: cache domain-containing protein, partial [Granulosicoccaceae bacterium]